MSGMSKAATERHRRLQEDVRYDVLDVLIEHGHCVVQEVAEYTGHPVARTYAALIALEVRGYTAVDGRSQMRNKPLWTVTDAGRVYAITPIAG